MERVPIPDAHPVLPSLDRRCIEGVVTLIWPYSSSTKSAAVLLAEPDFRLRRSKGQIRIQFNGPSATAIAESRISIGDEVSLGLGSAEWLETLDKVNAPGRSSEWELRFGQKLFMQSAQEDVQIHRGAQELASFDIASPPSAAPSPTQLATPRRSQSPPLKYTAIGPITEIDPSQAWNSPAYLKQRRLPSDLSASWLYDPLADEDGFIKGKGRKRTKFSRDSGEWRYVGGTSSSEKDRDDEVHRSWSDLTRQVTIGGDGAVAGLPQQFPSMSEPVLEDSSQVQQSVQTWDMGRGSQHLEPSISTRLDSPVVVGDASQIRHLGRADFYVASAAAPAADQSNLVSLTHTDGGGVDSATERFETLREAELGGWTQASRQARFEAMVYGGDTEENTECNTSQEQTQDHRDEHTQEHTQMSEEDVTPGRSLTAAPIHPHLNPAYDLYCSDRSTTDIQAPLPQSRPPLTLTSHAVASPSLTVVSPSTARVPETPVYPLSARIKEQDVRPISTFTRRHFSEVYEASKRGTSNVGAGDIALFDEERLPLAFPDFGLDGAFVSHAELSESAMTPCEAATMVVDDEKKHRREPWSDAQDAVQGPVTLVTIDTVSPDPTLTAMESVNVPQPPRSASAAEEVASEEHANMHCMVLGAATTEAPSTAYHVTPSLSPVAVTSDSTTRLQPPSAAGEFVENEPQTEEALQSRVSIVSRTVTAAYQDSAREPGDALLPNSQQLEQAQPLKTSKYSEILLDPGIVTSSWKDENSGISSDELIPVASDGDSRDFDIEGSEDGKSYDSEEVLKEIEEVSDADNLIDEADKNPYGEHPPHQKFYDWAGDADDISADEGRYKDSQLASGSESFSEQDDVVDLDKDHSAPSTASGILEALSPKNQNPGHVKNERTTVDSARDSSPVPSAVPHAVDAALDAAAISSSMKMPDFAPQHAEVTIIDLENDSEATDEQNDAEQAELRTTSIAESIIQVSERNGGRPSARAAALHSPHAGDAALESSPIAYSLNEEAQQVHQDRSQKTETLQSAASTGKERLDQRALSVAPGARQEAWSVSHLNWSGGEIETIDLSQLSEPESAIPDSQTIPSGSISHAMNPTPSASSARVNFAGVREESRELRPTIPDHTLEAPAANEGQAVSVHEYVEGRFESKPDDASLTLEAPVDHPLAVPTSPRELTGSESVQSKEQFLAVESPNVSAVQRTTLMGSTPVTTQETHYSRLPISEGDKSDPLGSSSNYRMHSTPSLGFSTQPTQLSEERPGARKLPQAEQGLSTDDNIVLKHIARGESDQGACAQEQQADGESPTQIPEAAPAMPLSGELGINSEQSVLAPSHIEPVSQPTSPGGTTLRDKITGIADLISPLFKSRRSSRLAQKEYAQRKPDATNGVLSSDQIFKPRDANRSFSPTQISVHSAHKPDAVTPTLLSSRLLHVTGFRTPISYYTPLSQLPKHLNTVPAPFGDGTVDVLAVVLKPTDKPERAKSWPRDYFTQLEVLDASIATRHDRSENAGEAHMFTAVKVMVFRPWKASLPIAESGNTVLLKDFVVRSAKGRCFLLSGANSAWCVWRRAPDVADNGSESDVRTEECKGPPVEIGDEERAVAEELQDWWMGFQTMQRLGGLTESNGSHVDEGTV